jgi:nucleoside-diphosphate-sugar epimerase
MIGIDNITPFIERLLDEPISRPRPFLLSDKETVSVEELLWMIGKGLGRKPRPVKLPVALLQGIALMGDVIAPFGVPFLTSQQLSRLTDSLVVDSSRAWREVGLIPPVPITVGIARTAEWYRSEVGR